MNPIEKFNQWYSEEVKKSSVRIPSACCLTSIGMDGYPNSRFVSLKETLENKFVITGPLNSKKGVELLSNPKTSLTFWWTETERQIRIQGDSVQIETELADRYFSERNKESQIVSQISKQGAQTENLNELITLFDKLKTEYESIEINRPNDWSGFYIIPKRIEFMEFKKSRFHFRELFTNENGNWNRVVLQP
ncbi:pyridoxal 5'-phosphate synthase [Aquimarina sp. 2201CG5-10]|uniref:pyridoxine/pyridoxamine 5'-phosphate oxidase n=1 Tax=Aquimarina callyspongiae TaxID=3098150 RepID=UPI002AB46691|nr:pyridoxal 5'-phosphate synthase [Aquimarina sp. 2201CG5-10]MDY8135390.1 pyridoxal 5'-phosphate synthase [Aquimarina sp. 2201CG5-10]